MKNKLTEKQSKEYRKRRSEGKRGQGEYPDLVVGVTPPEEVESVGYGMRKQSRHPKTRGGKR